MKNLGLDLYCKGVDEFFHSSYSGFFRIREAISNAIGLPIHLMKGFMEERDNDIHFGLHIEDIEDIYRVGLPINWNILKYDPLYKLINHSDCDGRLSWRIIGKISKRLIEIEKDIDFEKYNIHKKSYLTMINLFKEAHKIKKDIIFS